MIWKRDGDRRVYELPPKMHEDNDFDLKILLAIILVIVYRSYNFQDRKVRNQCKKKPYMELNLTRPMVW